MTNLPKKILIIIQRSNGDVFFSSGLINSLFQNYNKPEIDILVNDDTVALARLIPNIRKIITFSYREKKQNRLNQEKNIIKKIFNKYDMSVCLTASDRSVIYALLASRYSISAVEKDFYKSWWKKLLLKKSYFFDNSKHIVENNFQPLSKLEINYNNSIEQIQVNQEIDFKVRKMLDRMGLKKFLIFHPSAQYDYKIYPQILRDKLLELISSKKIDLVVTGGPGILDQKIKNTIPKHKNIHNIIGETSIEEYFAISSLSSGYIGMDTLNMHIAASQNKRIFAIFGPTNLKMWSPWSNVSNRGAGIDAPIQSYDNITIFQANLPCVACGKAGCNDNHGKSECLYHIDPKKIFLEIEKYLDTF